jgi:phosphoribosylaminoimidazole-succinocarboxamide synthase
MEGIPEYRERVRRSTSGGPARIGPAAGADLHSGHRQRADDENISEDEASRPVGQELVARLKALTFEIYRRGAAHALSKGIIVADTKFEFGLARRSGEAAKGGAVAAGDPDRDLVLIDEVLTPDSSRFWPESKYEPGRGQPSFDKQYVRDYLEEIRWNKQPPVPSLPDDVVRRTREKYVEAFTLLSGRELA